ncbi:MAG: LysM peptidoglycan-binding domain-containing protein [Armatimonadetes bacterium]|nr:LysM peptidoglycan-binding domain-containing protein [Armatimonadota bacterium]
MTRPKVWVLLAAMALPVVVWAQSPVIIAAPDAAPGPGDAPVADGARPLLSINSIDQGSAVSGEKPIDVTFKPAGDGVPLAKVDVLIDGAAKIMFDLKPEDRNVSYTWDTRDVADGRHIIEAVVSDREGRTRSYQTFVFVRNAAGPAPAVGSRLDVLDKGGAPTGIITGDALIRVVPDPTVGAQWVIIYVNDKMKAMMNRPPYQDVLRPTAAMVGAPIIVRASVIRPDQSREEIGPFEARFDPAYTKAPTAPTITRPLAPVVKTVPEAALVTGAPGTVETAGTPRVEGAAALGNPTAQIAGSVQSGGPLAMPGADLHVMGTAGAVPVPAAAVGVGRPTYVGPQPAAPSVTLPAARVGLGAAPALAPVDSVLYMPEGFSLNATVSRPGLPLGDGRIEPSRTTDSQGSAAVAVAPHLGPALGPVAPTVGVSVPRVPSTVARTGRTLAATSSGVSRSVVPTRLAPPAEGLGAGEQTPHVALPSGTRVERVVSRPQVGPAMAKMHLVAKGDTLAAISRKFGVSVEDLRRLNRLSPKSPLAIGQRLVVPRGDLSINGVTVHTDVAPLQHHHGVATAPLRFVVEGMGGSVSWIGPSQTVSANTGKRGILTITVGSREARLGNERILMDLAAYLEGDRTMVPARFISEAFDVTIDMDPDSGNILIRSND